MNEQKHRILIADDNAANRELLEAHLLEFDFELDFAEDGDQTLDRVKANKPDLILLDVMMPRLSGFEVCSQIKGNPETSSIMILMVTALNELGDIERAISCGTDDFLSKPFSKAELIKRVQNMLRLKDTSDENERLRRYICEMENGSRSPT